MAQCRAITLKSMIKDRGTPHKCKWPFVLSSLSWSTLIKAPRVRSDVHTMNVIDHACTACAFTGHWLNSNPKVLSHRTQYKTWDGFPEGKRGGFSSMAIIKHWLGISKGFLLDIIPPLSAVMCMASFFPSFTHCAISLHLLAFIFSLPLPFPSWGLILPSQNMSNCHWVQWVLFEFCGGVCVCMCVKPLEFHLYLLLPPFPMLGFLVLGCIFIVQVDEQNLDLWNASMESFRDLQSFSVTCGGREAPCGNRWGSGDTWLFGHLVQTRNLGGVEGKEYTYGALAQLKKKKPRKSIWVIRQGTTGNHSGTGEEKCHSLNSPHGKVLAKHYTILVSTG